MGINKPGNKIQNLLKDLKEVKSLSDYTIKLIDGEYVIYKDYVKFDIEVSGLDNNKKSINGTVYIWNKDDSLRIVKKLKYHNMSDLRNILFLIEEYSDYLVDKKLDDIELSELKRYAY